MPGNERAPDRRLGIVGGIGPESTGDYYHRLVAIVEGMRADSAIDGVILGGTQLPLILREPVYADVPVLDATRIHVEAALDWLLAD